MVMDDLGLEALFRLDQFDLENDIFGSLPLDLVDSSFSSHSNLDDDNSVELSQNNVAPAEEGSATHISNGENEEIIEYSNGDPLFPIYERKQKPLATKIVAKGIVYGINDAMIAKLVPHQPNNVSYMIGTNFLGHWTPTTLDTSTTTLPHLIEIKES